MKRRSWLTTLLLLSSTALLAQPVSQKEAETLVTKWLGHNPHPLMEATMGTRIDTIKVYKDEEGKPLYYIVNLKPSGYVIVAGDDTVEPVIAFSGTGRYKDSDDNPLHVLIEHDVPKWIEYARELEDRMIGGEIEFAAESTMDKAKKKWRRLLNMDIDDEKATVVGSDDDSTETGVDAVADVRVAPLLKTKWSQTKERGGHKCYNLYTPNNYPCGCVATAFGQVLRYFEYPKRGVGTDSYSIKVDGNERSKSLLGGDGQGGAYDWSKMSFGPYVSSEESRKAIGRLLNDTGVSVHMQYASGGSGAHTTDVADALKTTFYYENAVKAHDHYGIDKADAVKMINPDLDAGLPVILGVHRSGGGHAVVVDGYGYDEGTMYHHVNMGWSGSYNAWYKLPRVDAGSHDYTSIHNIVYNIYAKGSGEIVSGRVTDKDGHPVANATVTAKNGGRTYQAKTNEKGIYALVHLPPNTRYTITVKKSGLTFDQKTVSTGESEDYQSIGNVWGVDFVAKKATPNPTPSGTIKIFPIINYLLGA